MRDKDQCPVGFVVLFGCCYSDVQFFWSRQASVSSLFSSVGLVSLMTDGEINAFLSKFIHFSSFLSKSPKVAG